MTVPDNWEEKFKELDANVFSFFAKALAGYKQALIETGAFNSQDAQRLVESYAKFIYDMSIEEYLDKSLEDDDNSDENYL